MKSGKIKTGKLAKILVKKGMAKEVRERKPKENQEEKTVKRRQTK